MYPYTRASRRSFSQNKVKQASHISSDSAKKPAESFEEFLKSSTFKSISAAKYASGKEGVKSCCDNTPDNSMPDNSMPDNSMPDNSMPDNSMPDNSMPDNSMPDNSMPDNGSADCYEEINIYITKMIIEAIKDEIADARFYDTLANSMADDNDRRILHKIHHDEEKHKKMFMEIYEILTGTEPSAEDLMTEDKEISGNMTENFSNALFDELSAVEFYRKLYFVFLNQELRDYLFEIITDEQGHAQIMNYLYSKYINS